MKNYDPYKKTILFFASIINIVLMSAAFAGVWYSYYSKGLYLEHYFYRKGNYLIILFFAILLFFFSKMYGGLRIGQLRRIEVMLSQYLSLFLTNVMIYMVISMLAFRPVNPVWLFVSFLVEIVVSTVWNFIIIYFYNRIFQPWKILLIYG